MLVTYFNYSEPFYNTYMYTKVCLNPYNYTLTAKDIHPHNTANPPPRFKTLRSLGQSQEMIFPTDLSLQVQPGWHDVSKALWNHQSYLGYTKTRVWNCTPGAYKFQLPVYYTLKCDLCYHTAYRLDSAAKLHLGKIISQYTV